MASETHNVKKRNFYNNIEDHSIDHPRKRISNFTNKNMKDVKKSPKQLAAYINGTVGHVVKSPDKLRKVIYHRKEVHYPLPNSCFKKKQSLEVGAATWQMKKMNWPAQATRWKNYTVIVQHICSTPVVPVLHRQKAHHHNTVGFPEVSEDHETMAQVLFSRSLRFNVALTFWNKRRISELVAYLKTLEWCLPVLSNSLQEEKQYISLGCCVDLLPLVKSLLKSKFEEYIIVGLNWLQAVIERWWSELSPKTEIINDGNIQILKQQLSGLWEQENHFSPS
ncbi:hypothetical protein QTO34_008245, partial [Cnephaeus nilssonii]